MMGSALWSDATQHYPSIIYIYIYDTYFSQAPPLLNSIVMECVCPCALHAILAHHRYLWKFLADILAARGQEDLIAAALHEIGAYYFAFQYASYLNRYRINWQLLKFIGLVVIYISESEQLLLLLSR